MSRLSRPLRHVPPPSALLLTFALAGLPASAAATPSHPADSVAAADARRIDPRLMPLARRADAPARIASRVPVDEARTAITFPHPNVRQSVGLMVGGGAAVVAGAVVGGNVGGALAMGGVVAGFYGLYHYMTRGDVPPTRLR